MNNSLLTIYQRSKEDESDDSLFYSTPRYVHHLDMNFRRTLTSLYDELIPEESIILDLMSSWVSHLPNKRYKKVVGHGLNTTELSQNMSLDSYWVQNLNINQELPLESNSIDYCLLVAGWQYLQYPEKVASEVNRITQKGGKFVISFSNRAFWTKSPRIWTESSEENRINYVKSVLLASDWHIEKLITKQSRKESLFNFLNNQQDPFYSIIAMKI